MLSKSIIMKILDALPDAMFLKLKFRLKTNKKLNLRNPVMFSEKLQWLKLHDRKAEYKMMVDKYAVKEYVSDCIGEEYVIPTLGVWNSVEEIDFDTLPKEFVLKCTHDSGGIVLCRDKSSLNYAEVRSRLSARMSYDFYRHNREWPYKDLYPRVFAERLIEDPWCKENVTARCGGEGLIDYKFYCFHGKPKFLYVAYANIVNGAKHDMLTYLTVDWQVAPFYRCDHQQMPQLPPKPKELEEMLRIASVLSNSIPFVRVDLYNIDGQIYFSELTFCPGGGFNPFRPEEWEKTFGEWIRLPERHKRETRYTME